VPIDTEKIKKLHPLEDYVRSLGIVLKPVSGGRELVGRCPFHEDKSGHLYVNPGEQVFHCKVCDARGSDVIDFVKLHDHLTSRKPAPS
jgi:DNA primase